MLNLACIASVGGSSNALVISVRKLFACKMRDCGWLAERSQNKEKIVGIEEREFFYSFCGSRIMNLTSSNLGDYKLESGHMLLKKNCTLHNTKQDPKHVYIKTCHSNSQTYYILTAKLLCHDGQEAAFKPQVTQT